MDELNELNTVIDENSYYEGSRIFSSFAGYIGLSVDLVSFFRNCFVWL